jgi:hypothetical protein
MGRKEATSPQAPRAAVNGHAGRTTSHAHWPLPFKAILLAGGVAVLLGGIAVGVTREANPIVHAPMSPVASPTRPIPPPRPAFTRAEETYIQALWPIHGEVERSAVRVSLGNIFYKMHELDKAELKVRVDAAVAAYQQAEARISALLPPPSLADAHHDYLAAVRLFEESTREVLKMFDDGDDGHLLAAQPLSQEGSNKIRKVGAQFWQHEFTAH